MIQKYLKDLVAIPGISAHEKPVREYILKHLKAVIFRFGLVLCDLIDLVLFPGLLPFFLNFLVLVIHALPRIPLNMELLLL